MWRWNPYADEWHSSIEYLSRKNSKPFKDWFPEGQNRIHIPFERLTGGDDEIISLLEDEGYEIVDYRAGHCRRPGKNIQRIGKVLNNLKKRELRILEEKHRQGEIYNLRREISETAKYFDDLIKKFTVSQYRGAGKTKLLVVISQNPHDIAKMSTEREWDSCMTLPTLGIAAGAHHDSVLKEVENGGLVAYLIYADDLEIKKPLSRIHIRRFKNKHTGRNVARPERSIYGLEIAGFAEVVDTWLFEKQGILPEGLYRLLGGSYSDTYSTNELIAPENFPTLLRWMRGQGLEDIPYTIWVVTREVPDDLIEDGEETSEPETIKFDSQEAADNYVKFHWLSQDSEWREGDINSDWDHEEGEAETRGHWAELEDPDDEDSGYKNDPFSVEEVLIDDRPQMRIQAALTLLTEHEFLPKHIIDEIKEISSQAGYHAQGLKKALLKYYPKFLTQKELEAYDRISFRDFLKSLTPNDRQPYIHRFIDDAFKLATEPWNYFPKCIACRQPIIKPTDKTESCGVLFHHICDPENARTICQRMRYIESSHRGRSEQSDRSVGWEHMDFLYHSTARDILHLIQEFVRPIPENLIRELVIMPSRTCLDGYYLEQFHAMVIDLFSITGSDTPTVQQYYQYVLPHWTYEFKEAKYPFSTRVSIDVLGSAIARLGENGKQFLPFLYKRLDKLRKDFGDIIFDPDANIPNKENLAHTERRAWNQAFFTVERYLYIIDSIESGLGRSTKYSFNSPIERKN